MKNFHRVVKKMLSMEYRKTISCFDKCVCFIDVKEETWDCMHEKLILLLFEHYDSISL